MIVTCAVPCVLAMIFQRATASNVEDIAMQVLVENPAWGSSFAVMQDESSNITQLDKAQYDADGFLKVESAVPESVMGHLDNLLDSIVSNNANRELFGKNVFDLNAEYGKPLQEHQFGLTVNFPNVDYVTTLGMEGINAETTEGLQLQDALQNLHTILHDIVLQLFGQDMVLFFFRYVVKFGNSTDNDMKWHQDYKYCSALLDNQPIETIQDNRAATLLIALDDIDENNGWIQYLPGSQLGEVRHQVVSNEKLPKTVFTVTHVPLDMTNPQVADQVVGVNLRRGDLVVHNGYTLHSSGPNHSDRWRRVFAVQFRSKESAAKRGVRDHNRVWN